MNETEPESCGCCRCDDDRATAATQREADEAASAMETCRREADRETEIQAAHRAGIADAVKDCSLPATLFGRSQHAFIHTQ